MLAQYPAAPLRAAGVLHVVPGGAGAQTGVDWANAKDLQAALAAATSGDQITASFIGFVNGDTATNLDIPVQLSTTATIISTRGRYPIMASGASDANYDITFIPGTLTVINGRTYLPLIGR